MKEIIELENTIKTAKRQIKALKKAEKQKENKEIIKVPDNIEIYQTSYSSGDRLGIGFPNSDQVLVHCNNTWIVTFNTLHKKIKCKLIPVDKSDLIIGHTYFTANTDDISNKYDVDFYMKYLGNSKHAYITNNHDIVTSCAAWKYYDKVVPIDE